MDCSALVSKSLAAAGLKLAPGVDVGGRWNTQAFFSSIGKRNSCFALPQSSSGRVDIDTLLQPGDLMNHIDNYESGRATWRHMFVIDTVGKDPLGIGTTKNSADCKYMNAGNFNFSFIQSSSYGGPDFNGVHRVHGRKVSKAMEQGLLLSLIHI